MCNVNIFSWRDVPGQYCDSQTHALSALPFLTGFPFCFCRRTWSSAAGGGFVNSSTRGGDFTAWNSSPSPQYQGTRVACFVWMSAQQSASDTQSDPGRGGHHLGVMALTVGHLIKWPHYFFYRLSTPKLNNNERVYHIWSFPIYIYFLFLRSGCTLLSMK